ncbi:MAG: hypothetical protein GC136_07245 [Alphaproteobacteria bacterium]|nr:hypothetical protein [Alphaproteobacteria bacterium]
MSSSDANPESANPQEDMDDGVEMFHRVNRLKMKTGLLPNDDNVFRIEKEKVDSAQVIIESKASLYPNEVKNVLNALDKAWQDSKKAATRDKAKPHLEKLFHKANQIKDLASTFSYVLMQYFGMSLRDFIEKIDIENPKHLIIVQAHIDVMWVVLNENIKDEGGDKAKELKMIVAKAIEKYSQ